MYAQVFAYFAFRNTTCPNGAFDFSVKRKKNYMAVRQENVTKTIINA